MQRLRFYISHSFNDLWVGGQRTIFALLCIAVGVATVVSLQTLGAMIENTLTTNLQEVNIGDLNITPPRPGRPTTEDADEGREAGHLVSVGGGVTIFTEEGYAVVEEWIKERYPEAEITYRHYFPNNPTHGQYIEHKGDTEAAYGLFIEKEKYPLYGEALTLEGQPISEVMRDPEDIVISENMADDYGIAVGDPVRIAGAGNKDFFVRGVMDVETEKAPENLSFGLLFGYFYIDVSAVPLFDVSDAYEGQYASEIFVKLPDPDSDTLRDIKAEFDDDLPYVSVFTTDDLRERNSQISNAFNDLVLIMGLVSLLIGGIGIVNTMLMIVSRRTTEIAILKTVGLKARQVTELFLVEAIILGIVGSLIGIPLGLVASLGLPGFSENFLAQRLDWVFDASAVWRGFVLGVVVTGVFGLLPTLIAGQVRPGQVLRPSDKRMPRIGILQTLLVLVVMFIVLGAISYTILESSISPNVAEVGSESISGIVAVLALTAGLGGGAIAPGLPFFEQRIQPSENGRSLRWGILGLGTLLQMALQGVLFFSLFTVLLVIFTGEFSETGQTISLVVAGLIGLTISLQSLRKERTIPMTFGVVTAGFLGGALLGALAGVVIGFPLYFIIDAISTDAWQGVVDIAMNIALVEAATIAVGLIVGVLWLLIALAAGFPSLGIPDVKISLRTLYNNRNRTSVTVLALVIGVLALSVTIMLTESIRRYFEISLVESAGGNVFIVTQAGSNASWETHVDALEAELNSIEAINDYTTQATFTADLTGVIKTNGDFQSRQELLDLLTENMANDQRSPEELRTFFDFTFGQIDGRSVSQALPQNEFEEGGRNLRAGDACLVQLQTADECERRVVVSGNLAVRGAEIETGDILVMKHTDAVTRLPVTLRYTIVGVTDESLGDVEQTFGFPIYTSIDGFTNEVLGEDVVLNPNGFLIAIADVDEAQIPVVRDEVDRDIENAYVIDVTEINEIASDFIDRLTALPILVSVLAVFTGGVVIANSVVLSTIERRREIAIMKAIGLQRERVLAMLLFENSLMGFLGGIIGVGSSVVVLIWVWSLLFTGDLRDAVPLTPAIALMIGCIVLAILAAIVTAWRASGEKPLLVLRDE
jgi:ABC-type antimicrobial peptide transport system permease subunit